MEGLIEVDEHHEKFMRNSCHKGTVQIELIISFFKGWNQRHRQLDRREDHLRPRAFLQRPSPPNHLPCRIQHEKEVLFQVCPLTQIFLVCLLLRNHWFAWRANQWPLSSGQRFSLAFLPVSVLDPWLASCTASGTKGRAVLGAGVPGHRQEQLTQTLIVRLF